MAGALCWIFPEAKEEFSAFSDRYRAPEFSRRTYLNAKMDLKQQGGGFLRMLFAHPSSGEDLARDDPQVRSGRAINPDRDKTRPGQVSARGAKQAETRMSYDFLPSGQQHASSHRVLQLIPSAVPKEVEALQKKPASLLKGTAKDAVKQGRRRGLLAQRNAKQRPAQASGPLLHARGFSRAGRSAQDPGEVRVFSGIEH